MMIMMMMMMMMVMIGVAMGQGVEIGAVKPLQSMRLSKGHRDDRTSSAPISTPCPIATPIVTIIIIIIIFFFFFITSHTLANGKRELEDPWIRPH